MSEAVQIRRDPFARASLMREVASRRQIPPASPWHSCAWCGVTDTTKTLFRYWWQSDGRSERPRGEVQFCSVSCWETYNS